MMRRSSSPPYACNSSSRISCFELLCIISFPVFLVWLVLSATDSSSYSSPSRRTWRSSRGSREGGEGEFVYVANSSARVESQIYVPPAAAPSPSPKPGPHVSYATSHLCSNSIRALCNANTSEGFNPDKDLTLPEINLKTGLTTGIIGGPSASGRPILAFFAGGLHGPIRPLFLKKWKDKDEDVRVYEYLPGGVSYYDMIKKSRFCICPSGYEVASPRIVETIYLECVPVIISDHYVLPFSDVLNWKAFSVQVSVEEIPNLKKILACISSRQYIRMQRRVRMVQRHFVVSTPPMRLDVFHMILHSIWLRR